MFVTYTAQFPVYLFLMALNNFDLVTQSSVFFLKKL